MLGDELLYVCFEVKWFRFSMFPADLSQCMGNILTTVWKGPGEQTSSETTVVQERGWGTCRSNLPVPVWKACIGEDLSMEGHT